MMLKVLRSAPFFGTLFASVSCFSAFAATKQVPLEDFTAVELSGNVEIDGNAGEKASLTLEGQEEVLSKIEVSVQGKVLKISRKRAFLDSCPSSCFVKVKLSFAELDSLQMSGKVSGSLQGLKGKSLKVEGSGKSDLRLAGKVQGLKLDFSGASSVDASALEANEASLEASGASTVKVWAVDSLQVKASGASEVFYKGKPKTLDQDVSGVSKLKAL